MSDGRKDFLLLIGCILVVIAGGVFGAIGARVASPHPDTAKSAAITVTTDPVQIAGGEATSAGVTAQGETVILTGDYVNGETVKAFEWVDGDGGVYYSSGNPILNSFIGWAFLGLIIGIIALFPIVGVAFWLDERTARRRRESQRVVNAALY